MGYHHGDLRAALIRTSFELLAECGLSKFSVAAVARRLGVSSAAPYRHFPDRDHLLSAVSAAAASDLREAMLTAVAANPDDGLAAAAGAYVRYVVRTGAGIHVIFATELYALPDDARREQTRALMTTMLDLTGHDVRLLEATLAVAHGYASLIQQHFFSKDTVDDVADRAAAAARALV
ncbi:TetR/AcrR family transcriptional regulator [Actinoplanes sp. TRM 88003]|uniref:TetR/AcrR family transcriptional regulator n=1 Tax=Paractinoplanes aksuensis TaxID=2939490 RepID=A0ABT1E2C7_9ACTN|nr:TetR/AcrR family transcriptional regulator [Actinoplanes aksuensis]MCO8277295.1 TetR/AcrR family transcriptional regulator [Actinoplanes aksuensis]